MSRHLPHARRATSMRLAVVLGGALGVLGALCACGLSVVGAGANDLSPGVDGSRPGEPERDVASPDGLPPDAGGEAGPDSGSDALDPTRALLWFDANTLVLDDGAKVASWPDLSPGAHHAAQTSTGNQPTYETNVVGGRPAIHFDESKKTYLVTAPLALFATNTSGLTVVVVFRAAKLDKQRFLFMQPQSNCMNNFEIGYRTGDQTRPNFGLHAGCNFADVTATDIDTDWHIFTTVVGTAGVAPANVQFFRDGSQVASQANVTGWPSAGSYGVAPKKVVIGARDDDDLNAFNSYHEGEIAEIIAFEGALDTSSRGALERALKTKYGL